MLSKVHTVQYKPKSKWSTLIDKLFDPLLCKIETTL